MIFSYTNQWWKVTIGISTVLFLTYLYLSILILYDYSTTDIVLFTPYIYLTVTLTFDASILCHNILTFT